MDERNAPAPDLPRTGLRAWALLVSVGVLLVCAGSASAANVPVTAQLDNTFNPPAVTISQGDTVTWTNAGGMHNVVLAPGFIMPGSPMLPGASWPVSRPFPAAGEFTYVCGNVNHPDMTGTVTVLAAAPPPGGGGPPGGDPGPGGEPGDSKTDLKKLQLKVSDATASRGDRIRFYGSVRPAIEGSVLIQRRERNGKYKSVAKARLKKDGNVSTYSKRLRAKTGVYRAAIRENADHEDATSRPKRIR